MAKDPAILFYPNDWLGGTMGMTFEEKGAYIDLLVMQFNRGHMTSHMIGHTVGQLWDKIKVKFVQDENGLWYNVRWEEERIKRQNYTASRVNNKSGKNQYIKDNEKSGHMIGHMIGHTVGHMENENENENEINNNSPEKEIQHKHGKYNHILLTDKQLDTLLNLYGKHKTDYLIQLMDNEIEEKGNIWHIKNFSMAIQKWEKKDKDYKPPQRVNTYTPEYIDKSEKASPEAMKKINDLLKKTADKKTEWKQGGKDEKNSK